MVLYSGKKATAGRCCTRQSRSDAGSYDGQAKNVNRIMDGNDVERRRGWKLFDRLRRANSTKSRVSKTSRWKRHSECKKNHDQKGKSERKTSQSEEIIRLPVRCTVANKDGPRRVSLNQLTRDAVCDEQSSMVRTWCSNTVASATCSVRSICPFPLQQ